MAVIIGMDPHKRSATIEVINELGVRIGVGKFGTDQFGYAEMLTAGRRFIERIWAVEGCNGVGRHIAHRLVHDGETVLDVPATTVTNSAAPEPRPSTGFIVCCWSYFPVAPRSFCPRPRPAHWSRRPNHGTSWARHAAD